MASTPGNTNVDVSSWVDKKLSDIKSDPSASKQLIIGSLSGFLAGVVCAKVGKVAATATAGTMLLVYMGQHKGYVKVDWPKMSKELEKAKKKLLHSGHGHKDLTWCTEEIKDFVMVNKYAVISFGIGFGVGTVLF